MTERADEARALAWHDGHVPGCVTCKATVGRVAAALAEARAERERIASIKRGIEQAERGELERGPCTVCWFVAWEPTPEGERCGHCWLREQFDRQAQEIAALREALVHAPDMTCLSPEAREWSERYNVAALTARPEAER